MKRNFLKYLLLQVCTILCVQLAFAQTKDFKKDFGARGDGITDDSKAWANAIDYFNKTKKGELYIPKGTYRVGKQVFNKQKGKPFAELAYGRNTLKHVNGVTIRGEVDANGKPVANFKYLDNIFYGYFDANTKGRTNNSNVENQASADMFLALDYGCKNVKIFNLNIDGNSRNSNYQQLSSGRGYDLLYCGIYIAANMGYGVEVENVHVKDFGLDGFYVQTNQELAGRTNNTVIRNCSSDGNGRQGLSFTMGSGLLVQNSSFTNTSSGKIVISPGANIDVENHHPQSLPIKNSKFVNCILKNQKSGSGSLNIAGKVENIEFVNSEIISEISPLAIQFNYSPSKNFTFKNCKIVGLMEGSYNSKEKEKTGTTRFINCNIFDNSNNHPFYKNRAMINIVDGVEFENCNFYLDGERKFLTSTLPNSSKQKAATIRKSNFYEAKTRKKLNENSLKQKVITNNQIQLK